jgi:hypothetical protein
MGDMFCNYNNFVLLSATSRCDEDTKVKAKNRPSQLSSSDDFIVLHVSAHIQSSSSKMVLKKGCFVNKHKCKYCKTDGVFTRQLSFSTSLADDVSVYELQQAAQ